MSLILAGRSPGLTTTVIPKWGEIQGEGARLGKLPKLQYDQKAGRELIMYA